MEKIKDKYLYWAIGACVLLLAACNNTTTPTPPPALKWEVTYNPEPIYEATVEVGSDGKEYLTGFKVKN